MAREEPQQTQTIYTEYIPEDILHAAGIYGESLAMEQLRFELYELENEVAVGRGELEGMRKKWDGIKRSLRFSLIMLVVFFLLDQLMYRIAQEQIMISSMAGSSAEGEALILLLLIGVLSDVFRTIFYGLSGIFFVRSVHKLYQFLSNRDSETSRRWCEWRRKKNLCAEIEQTELRFMKLEERLRRLKQVRTIYRERKQEEWQEESLPERIVMERELG